MKEKNECSAEVWLPSRNETEAGSVFQFISLLPENISLEYFGSGAKRYMLIRGSEADIKSIGALISSMYPASGLHILDRDPVESLSGSPCTETVAYGFSGENYLPLRMFDNYKEYDPVHTLLSGLLDLGPDDLLLMRIHLRERNEPEWLDTVLTRVKAEKQRGFVTNAAMEQTGSSIGAYTPTEQFRTVDLKRAFISVLAMIGWVTVLLLLLLKFYKAMFAVLFISGLLSFIKSKMPSQLDDPWYRTDLDMLKLKAEGRREFNNITITVSAGSSDPARVREIQDRIRLILGRFGSSGGNSLVPVFRREGTVPPDDPSLPVMEMCDWELAGFWHIPFVSKTVSPGLIPVRGVEVRCPDADEVAGFYRIGGFRLPNGGKNGVFLNEEFMKHNSFLIGKPGTGKTTLMEHIARAAFVSPIEDSAVVVIDPHGDMYSRLLGCIPEERIGDVVLLDFGDPDYAVTYNPLDVHTSRLSPEQAAQMIVDIGKTLWDTSWGPRMQIPLQRSVTAIAAHNASMPLNYGADGLSLMGVLLNGNAGARARYLSEITDNRLRKVLERYFLFDFNDYKEYTREQIILPVLSKSYRFEESPMLEFFSAPYSVLNPAEIIRNKKILLVNTRMSELGSDLSDFIGSFIISVILKEISRQGENESGKRNPVMMIIDEFQTYTGVPWQELLAQLRKWGGRTVLGTQSFASMASEDSNELRGIIMSGVYSLFSFTVNGEDADYLAENELSDTFGGPTRDTLISLDPYTCYARIMRKDGKLTRPFFFHTAEPVASNPVIRREVLDERDKYARKRSEAVAEAAEYLNRIEQYGFYSSGKIVAGGSGAYARQESSAENALMEKQYTENAIAETRADADRELENAEKLLQNSGMKETERKAILHEEYGELFGASNNPVM